MSSLLIMVIHVFVSLILVNSEKDIYLQMFTVMLKVPSLMILLLALTMKIQNLR